MKTRREYFISSFVNSSPASWDTVCVASDSRRFDPEHDVTLSKYHEKERLRFAIKKKKKKKKHLPASLNYEKYVIVFQIQKREIKMCALVKELTESKTQHSKCQKEV